MEPTKKKVIAICSNGHGAGKTTLAEFIQDYYYKATGKDAHMLSFVNCLKGAASSLIDYNAVWDEKDKPLEELGGKTPRDLLIFLGEGIKREFNPKFFAEKAIEEIEETTYPLYIIDDLRFPVELDALYDQYGADCIPIYIHTPAAKECECEGLIDPFQAVWETYNTGTLGDLYDEAADIVEKMVLHNE